MRSFVKSGLFVLTIVSGLLCSCIAEHVPETSLGESMLHRTKSSVGKEVWAAYDYCNGEGYWLQFVSFEERMNAAQLPDDLIRTCSTEELLILCLNNPMTHIYTSYNNFLDAIDVISSSLNVIKELEERKDIEEVILSFCKSVIVEPSEDNYCVYRGGYYRISLLTYNFLKLYIGSGRIPSLFELANRQALEDIFEKRYDFEQSQIETFSWFSLCSTILILREIEFDSSISKEIAAQIFRKIVIEDTPTKSSTYNHLMRGEYNNVYTPNHTKIFAFLYYELSRGELDEINEDYRCRYGEDAIMEPATGTYNCHSYAWYISETPLDCTSCWIPRAIEGDSDSNLSNYWEDGSYHVVDSEADAVKIYYKNGDHSAIKSSEPNYYISKMGLGPKVKHLPNNVDYPLGNIMYFDYGAVPDVGTGDDGDNNDDDDDDNSGSSDHDPGEIVGTISPTLPIYGQTVVVAGQTYSYYVLPSTPNAYIQWSCMPKRGSSSNFYMSTTLGNRVSIRFEDVGSYSVLVSCSYDAESTYGTLNIQVVNSI